MKLTNRRIAELRQHMAALDGRAVPTTPGADGERGGVYVKPYNFTGTFRFRLSKLFHEIRNAAEVFDKARAGLEQQFAVRNHIPADRVVEFSAELEKILDQEVEINAEKIVESDLRLDTNEIPVTVLASLQALM